MIYQPGMTLELIEKEAIMAALKFCDNNKTRAAHALGISIKTLHNKLNSYGRIQPKSGLNQKEETNGPEENTGTN